MTDESLSDTKPQSFTLPDAAVSLGDIAMASGAKTAWWCLRVCSPEIRKLAVDGVLGRVAARAAAAAQNAGAIATAMPSLRSIADAAANSSSCASRRAIEAAAQALSNPAFTADLALGAAMSGAEAALASKRASIEYDMANAAKSCAWKVLHDKWQNWHGGAESASCIEWDQQRLDLMNEFPSLQITRDA